MVPLFVELCAGLASVSGVLEHGSTWKPPVSRMGRKTGYAGAILRVMGLRPRQKAERYLWAEADGDVAALLAAYTQPEKMRAIAAIIRSWIPCPYGPHEVDPSCPRCKGTGRWDARDLWEVLRREERRGLWEGGGEAGDVAAFAGEHAGTHPGGADFRGLHINRPSVDGWIPGREALIERFAALPWPPVLIAQDAAVDVGSVAGWAVQHARSDNIGHFAEEADDRPRGGWRGNGPGREDLAARFSCPVWPTTALTFSASIPPPPLPAGTVVYIDPPYLNTTGYKADFTRAQVCEAAERWATAGARVYISEAEPIAALGWHHVEITSERKGQARTFGATPEWLTCSHRPAWTPPIQGGLFQ